MEVPQIQKPFTIDEIRNSPGAVFSALLIIILFISFARIYYLETKKDETQTATEKIINNLYDQMLDEKDKRIFFYEQMIFFKNKSETLEFKDSVFKDNSRPYVEKILK